MLNIPKNVHFLPPDMQSRVSIRDYKEFVFRKIWRALFSCYLRFEIRPFTLLPTIYCLKVTTPVALTLVRIKKQELYRGPCQLSVIGPL